MRIAAIGSHANSNHTRVASADEFISKSTAR
jgi:hypothetical protein